MTRCCCENPQPLEEYVAALHAKVTRCVSCGAGHDYRPLRPQDEPSDERDPLAPGLPNEGGNNVEREIEELGRLGDGGAQVAAGSPSSDSAGFACSRHGGAGDPCDTGPGKAHHCRYSKWGEVRSCDGPCFCHGCHAWA